MNEINENRNLINQKEVENNMNNVSAEIENINNDIKCKKLKIKKEGENIEKLEIQFNEDC